MADIYNLLCTKIPHWECLSIAEITIQPVLGGLTNKLYVATVNSASEHKIIPELGISLGQPVIRKVFIRIFGNKAISDEQSQIERRQETFMVKNLASHSFAPKIYFDFDGGRFEEFIEGKRASMEDMQKVGFLKNLSKILAKFHTADIGQPKIPEKSQFLKHLDFFLKILSENEIIKNTKNTKTAEVFKGKEILQKRKTSLTKKTKSPKKINPPKSPSKKAMRDHSSEVAKSPGRITKKIKDEIAYCKTRLKTKSLLNMSKFPPLSELKKERKWLEKKLESMSLLLFCHNDVHDGNLIVSETDKRMFLIDYEYAGWNNYELEFGNLFCECYIDSFADNGNSFRILKEKIASDSVVESVLRAYWEERARIERVRDGDAAKNDRIDRNGFKNGLKQDLSVALKNVRLGMLCSHFEWSLWAILQDGNSGIKWCYRDYGLERMAEYFRLKEMYFGGEME